MAKRSQSVSRTSQAARWGVGKRQWLRWVAEGAPVDDDRRLAAWLAGRKHVPAAVHAKASELLASKPCAESSSPAASPSATAEPERREDIVVGAPAALRRLEEAEAAAYARWQKELSKEKPDALAVKSAREAWIKIGDSLRRYDLAVEESRRGAGELLARAEVEKLAENLAFWFLQAVNASENQLLREIVGCDSAAKVRDVLDRVFVNAFATAFLPSTKDSGYQLPPWLADKLRCAVLSYVEEEPEG